MNASPLGREHFSTPRAADYLEVRSLIASTGAPQRRFVGTALKELLDNALDAAEMHGHRPEVVVVGTGDVDAGTITLEVTDNGPGMPAHVVERILDFDHLVSDKARYCSPTRGRQGNAWKTILGIAAVQGGRPCVIEACGIRHVIGAELVGGHVVIRHDQADIAAQPGTTVTLTVDAGGQSVEVGRLVLGYALANPHLKIVTNLDERFAKVTMPTPADWAR